MQTYDIIMLIVLAATTIFGAIKGFAWQVASLASIVASYFVAYHFRNDVAKMINADPPWNLFLAMLLLYFGSSFVIWMAFRLVSTSIDKVKLREFDRHLGAGFGLIKGILFCLLITMFAMSLLGPAQQQRIANSKSGLYISRILASAGGLLPVEIKQVVGPYIQNVEQKLQQNQWPDGQVPAGYPVSEAGQGGWGGALNPNAGNSGSGGSWFQPSVTAPESNGSLWPPLGGAQPAGQGGGVTFPNLPGLPTGNASGQNSSGQTGWPTDILPR